MFSISNKGQAIHETNYWATEEAQAGYCYLSHNAAALRLLLPKSRECWLPDMEVAKKISIERSVFSAECIDIVFEDGTAAPFAIALSRDLMDCLPWKGRGIPFTVWGEAGLLLSFRANAKL